MGWGIGISIGWPASSGAYEPLNSGYWEILSYCPGSVTANTITDYHENVNWNPEDYVFSPVYQTRVLLGQYYQDAPVGSIIVNVIGPAYNSCG